MICIDGRLRCSLKWKSDWSFKGCYCPFSSCIVIFTITSDYLIKKESVVFFGSCLVILFWATRQLDGLFSADFLFHPSLFSVLWHPEPRQDIFTGSCPLFLPSLRLGFLFREICKDEPAIHHTSGRLYNEPAIFFFTLPWIGRLQRARSMNITQPQGDHWYNHRLDRIYLSDGHGLFGLKTGLFFSLH